MKTQLLQDLNESGSANARPPSPEAGKATGAAETRDAAVRPSVSADRAASPVTPAPTPEPKPAPAPELKTAPSAAPARAGGPAVWHRPQRDGVAAAVQAPELTVPTVPAPAPLTSSTPPSPPPPPRSPRPAEAELATVREARADAVRPASPTSPHATVQPRGFAPQPLPFGAPLPAQDPTDTAGRDPDWLAERLARDAAVHDRSEWGGSWTRRLASWGAAGVLLALVAAGGLWLYEQSQVEGALVVVANTNPAPAPASMPRAVTPPASPALPANAVLAPAGDLPAPAPVAAPPSTPVAASTGIVGQSTSAMGAPATGDTSAEKTVEAPAVAAVDTSTPVRPSRKAARSEQAERTERTGRAVAQADATPAKRKRSSAHKQTRTVASAADRVEERTGERSGERSYRQRYEETLMQCRAHGYDERQCLQRGCEMTRFGFACKG